MKLTEKQKRFVDYFIELGEATKAARKSGYSEGSVQDAPNWLNPRKHQYKPYLAKAIEKRLNEVATKRIANATEVLEFLTSVLRGEVTDENIVVETVGAGISRARTIETKISSKDRLNAAQQLLKRFPNNLDVKEQEARIERLALEMEKLKKQTDDVAGGNSAPIMFTFNREGS